MSKYYLMKFESDYCDEFNVQGFSLITLDQYKMYQFVADNKDKHTESFDIGFGTNEEIYFENLSEFLDCISIDEISTNDHRSINAYFGDNYGLVHPFKNIEYFAEELGYKKQPIIKQPTLYKIMNTSSNIEWLVNATREDIINYAKHKDIPNRDKITKLAQAIEVLEKYPNTIVIRQHDYLNDTKIAMIMGNHLNEFVSLHEYLLKYDYWYKEEMFNK